MAARGNFLLVLALASRQLLEIAQFQQVIMLGDYSFLLEISDSGNLRIVPYQNYSEFCNPSG